MHASLMNSLLIFLHTVWLRGFKIASIKPAMVTRSSTGALNKKKTWPILSICPTVRIDVVACFGKEVSTS